MSSQSWFAITPESIGDWDGAEDLAAAQMNRILQTINAFLPASVNPQIARNIYNRVLEDWGCDMRLLDASENDFHRYARALLRTAA